MTRPEPAGAGTAEDIARWVVDAVTLPSGETAVVATKIVLVAAITKAITASRRQAKEEDAKIAEQYPAQILQMWDRPGGPPGNGYRASTFADVAQTIRSSIDPPGEGE